jgi:ATP-binding cassette subfamily C protein
MGYPSIQKSAKIAGLKRAFLDLGVFSAASNVLLLVPSLYMLQVYDRVLPSSSVDTLIYISVIAAGALAVLGLLEIVRSYYANRLAARLDTGLGSQAFLASLNGPRSGLGDVQPLRDLATIRSFIASRSIFSLFDLPFAPIFLVVLYFLHPLLCLIATVGVMVMVAIALANQVATAKSGQKSAEALVGAMITAQSFTRNYETVRALGMVSNVTEIWGRKFADSLLQSDRVSVTNSIYGGISRFLRMLLQSTILGVGGYLVLQGTMSAGMIFASSLISGRALQPFDQIIGGWRQIIEAGRAWKRLKGMTAQGLGQKPKTMSMPAPTGTIGVEHLIYTPPESDPARPFIKRISFTVGSGESVAVIGPSRAGKSTLARLLVGVLKPGSGVIRLDGADIQTWDADAFGRHIGYLSQEVELFSATIAENIARFDPDATDETIMAAATRANCHQLILNQKNGYLTMIGPDGVRLSGGERQRVGLARAFYGDPRVLVLDEPNSNLDTEGEQALETALVEARKRGTTVLLITHKPSIALKCDRILMLREGQIELYGPAADVLQRLAQGSAKPPAFAAPPPPPEPQPSAASPAGVSAIRLKTH